MPGSAVQLLAHSGIVEAVSLGEALRRVQKQDKYITSGRKT